MTGHDERREVARSLRESWKQTWHGEKMMHRLRIALGIGHEVSAYGKFRYYRAVAERLANLIEPEPERTCGEWRGDPRHDAIGHAAAHEDDELWCEHCDIELDESWLYCPHCGARVVNE